MMNLAKELRWTRPAKKAVEFLNRPKKTSLEELGIRMI